MADYYPLIARAVAGLEKNTGEGRRVLYDRARQALVAQLRSVTPALSESDVTRERLALEEAVRKVEAESARRATIRTDTAKMRPPEFPRWEKPEPAAEPEQPPPPRRAQADPRQSGPAVAARLRGEPQRTDSIEEELPAEPVEQMPPRPAAVPRADGRQATAPASARMRSEPRPIDPAEEPSTRTEPSEPRAARPRPDQRSALSSGLREFREVVSQADETGGASARANRSAPEQLAEGPSPGAEPHRPQPRTPDSDESFAVIEDMAEPEMLEPTFVVEESRPVPPRARQAPPPVIDRAAPPRRSWALADMIRIASAAVILGGILAGLIWQWPNMVSLYGALWTPAPEVAKENPPPASKPKIADRVEPGGQAGQPAAAQDVPLVAQRVVLYEEDPTDPQGKRTVGSAVWRTETISPGAGRPPDLAVRADIEIPERKISMTWTLRRDTDQNRSTSHTIEIMFKLPPDYPSGGIFNVPGIWMKQAEQAQGTALAGLAVKVTTGYFLIGLSAAPADRERNIQLLKDRQWFDVAIVYNNNKRAILTMEKGTPGERAFADAFAAWEK
jgi:hypothetical protein